MRQAALTTLRPRERPTAVCCDGTRRITAWIWLCVVGCSDCEKLEDLSHLRPDRCAKLNCGFDGADLSGGIGIPSSSPANVSVETCEDGVCGQPVELKAEPGRYASAGQISLVSRARAQWAANWSPPSDADGGLASTYRIIIRNLDTGEVLVDREFEAEWQVEAARDCEPKLLPDGGKEHVTCTRFEATWD